MIAALVLAAGLSRRMGTQKLLLPLDHRPMIAHIVDEVLKSPVTMTVVVVGRDADPVTHALTGREVRLIRNPEPDGDMLSSVRAGLRALPESCTAFAVVLGDQPGLRATLIADLLRARPPGPASLVVPVHQGRRGHPVLIDMRFREEILHRHDGIGLRGLFQNHPGAIIEVPAASSRELEDLDRPEDYQRWLRRD